MNPHAKLIDESSIYEFDEQLMSEMHAIRSLLCQKRKDYGPGNLTLFGLHGILVRMADKVERLRNLHASGEAPQTDSLEDSWADIAGYAILALRLMHTQPSFGEKAFASQESAPQEGPKDCWAQLEKMREGIKQERDRNKQREERLQAEAFAKGAESARLKTPEEAALEVQLTSRLYKTIDKFCASLKEEGIDPAIDKKEAYALLRVEIGNSPAMSISEPAFERLAFSKLRDLVSY